MVTQINKIRFTGSIVELDRNSGAFFRYRLFEDAYVQVTSCNCEICVFICYNLGPMGGVLINVFGCRKVGLFGGFLSGLGLALTGLSSNVHYVCFTFGALTGETAGQSS